MTFTISAGGVFALGLLTGILVSVVGLVAWAFLYAKKHK